MKTALSGSAKALCALLMAQAAHAQSADPIVVEEQLLHPAAGLMNEHMHDGGEVMIGLRYERTSSGGTNQSGTDAISDADILAAGYTTRTKSMVMDMVMLDLMYAPTDNITLMVMPHYMWHRMEMVGIDPMAGMDDMDEHASGGHDMGGGMAGMDGHGHHSLGFGDVHSHSTQGFGDTLVSASYRLARSRDFSAHATLGIWAPTGAVDKTNPDGTFVHYGMQPGSGTWDVEPSVTVGGRSGAFGWGAQASYRWRAEKENSSGFSFGDKARTSAWLSTLLSNSVGATARLEYTHEGQIEGHYNAGHNHAAPPDRQENYGGDAVDASLGLNWLLPVPGAMRPQLGVEAGVPLYQDLNGIQAPEKWRMAVSLSQTF